MHKLGVYCIIVFSAFLWAGCNSANNSDKMPTEGAALSDLQKITKQIEENPTANNFYARYKYYNQEGQLPLAMEDLNNALQRDSLNGGFWLEKVKLLRKMQRISQSLNLALQVENMLPNNQELYIAEAEMYLILKEYQKALDNCNRALKVNSFNADAYFYKGLVYTEIKDTAKAISSLETAIEQSPEYIEAYNNLIIIYNSLGKYDMALQYGRSGLRFKETDPFINYNMGVTYQQMNDADTAAYFYENALKLDSTMYLAHFNMGSYHFNKEEFEKAENDFKKALNYKKDLPDANMYLAMAQQRQKKWDEAVENFKIAKDNNTDQAKFTKAYDSFFKEYKKYKKNNQ